MLHNRWLGLLLVALLATTTACGGSEDAEENTSADVPAELSDVPDVVAEVNGEEIPRADFVEAYEARTQQAAAQQPEQQPDEEELREQVVQSLVTEELLVQEAERRDISPSEEQVQQTLTELAEQNGMKSADDFVAALEEQGMESDEIDTQATQQTRFDLLVADEAGSIEATDKQVKALYQQLKAQQAGAGKNAQQLPPLDKVRSELEAQVESQQESEAARTLIDELREDADIELHV